MKKISLLLMSAFAMLTAWAGPVSRQQAQQIAQRYLQETRAVRGAALPQGELELAYEAMPKAARSQGINYPLFYVFNQANDNGIVVVSGDDRMKPVIGFADRGRFDARQLPEGFRWWMAAMEETMASVVKSDDKRTVNVCSSSEGLKAAVAPLVKTNWGQGYPYNLLCPVDKIHGNKKSLVGCTAVAMAQVLSKWQYPLHGTGLIRYTTYDHKFNLTAKLDTIVFDWDKILPNYGGKDVTDEQRHAVAELMYSCGLAVKMNYCANASGAKLVSDHFEQYLGIDPSCNIVERIYYTRAEWDGMIKKELSEGRPVVYSGYSMKAGHAFVCDGYNKEGLFHINWGWDGSLNGYFALAELNSAVEHAGAPTDAEGSFNLDQDIVMGIQPKVGEGIAPEPQLFYGTLRVIGTPTRSQTNVQISNLRADGNGYKGRMVLGLYDAEDTYVGRIGYVYNVDLRPQNQQQVYSVGGAFPYSLKDGNYVIRPTMVLKNNVFVPMRGRKGSSYVKELLVNVTGDKVVVTQPEKVDVDFKVVGIRSLADKVYAGAKNAFEITLHNAGAMYNGPIVLTRKNGDREEQVYDNNYIVESGEDLVLRVKLQSPEGVSSDTLSIWYAKSDGDIWHMNGYDQACAGKVNYEMIVPTAGAPALSAPMVKIANKTTYLGEALKVSITLKNNGGFYGNDISCFVFPSGGGNSLCSGRQQVFIDKGETKVVNVEIPVNSLTANKYFFHIYYIGADNSLATVNTTRYDFTVKDNGVISITNLQGYGVHCVDHAFIVPEGVECGVVTAADQTNMSIDYRYLPGEIVPAGTPVAVKAERRKSYLYDVVISSEEKPTDNILRAAVDEAGYTYAGEGEFEYFRFGADSTGTQYGFYKIDEKGSAFRLPKNKCYLAFPVGMGKADGYSFSAADVTAIEKVIAAEKASGIYTLSGVRVDGTLKSLPKGIYIVNGKKIMVK